MSMRCGVGEGEARRLVVERVKRRSAGVMWEEGEVWYWTRVAEVIEGES